VAQSLAAQGWGAVFTPRHGMEVLVHFIEGNPDRPVVTGALYNLENPPPLQLPENRSQTVLRTQTYGNEAGYNEVLFEDLAKHEQIALRAQRDLAVQVLNDRTATIGNNDTTTVEKDAARTVKGHATSTVKGTATSTVEGDGEATFKANAQLTVEKDASVSVLGKSEVTVSSTHRLSADDGITLECGQHKIEITPDGITLTCSPGKVTMNSQGIVLDVSGTKVELKAAEAVMKSNVAVTIQGGATVDVKADGIVNIKGSLVNLN
jgi:type VI secretion system secreted protein VgrG